MTFIMEESLLNIKSEGTKEVVKEIISSYQSGNYRSAIVLLHTAVIYDLLEKMVILKEIYKEEGAGEILESIMIKQKKNSRDSTWEVKFIEDVCKKTHIITEMEKEQLLNLKKERNYAAHPIVELGENDTNEIVLRKPQISTKETAKDLIRKAFEIVFLKDALLAKNIFLEVLNEANEYYSRLKLSGFKEHLNLKFFNRMTQERKDKVFRSLWQIVFISNKPECEENRKVNYYILDCMYKENPHYYKYLLKNEENHYFNKIKLEVFSFESEQEIFVSIDKFEKSRIYTLINFIINNNDVYDVFNEYSRNLIENVAKNFFLDRDIVESKLSDLKFIKEVSFRFSAQLKLRAECMFFVKSLKMHLSDINNMINNFCSEYSGFGNPNYLVLLDEKVIGNLFLQFEYRDEVNEFLDFMIRYCLKAQSYSHISSLFYLIEKYIKYFNENNFYTCLAAMNANNQCYNNDDFSRMLFFIENQFNKKFNRPLIENEIEKNLYTNIFPDARRIETEEGILIVLDKLEGRVGSFDGIWSFWHDTLRHISFDNGNKICIDSEKRYSNILKKLSDSRDLNYSKNKLEEFKSYFTTHNIN